MPVPQFITSVGAHSVVKTGLTSKKDNSVFDCNTFRRICHRNLCGIGSTHADTRCCRRKFNPSKYSSQHHLHQLWPNPHPNKKNTWVFDFTFNGRPSHWSPGSCCVFSSFPQWVPSQKKIPCRELTYPLKMAFWRWFSFSQGGIC